jgi:hypothetical protein
LAQRSATIASKLLHPEARTFFTTGVDDPTGTGGRTEEVLKLLPIACRIHRTPFVA